MQLFQTGWMDEVDGGGKQILIDIFGQCNIYTLQRQLFDNFWPTFSLFDSIESFAMRKFMHSIDCMFLGKRVFCCCLLGIFKQNVTQIEINKIKDIAVFHYLTIGFGFAIILCQIPKV